VAVKASSTAVGDIGNRPKTSTFIVPLLFV